MNDNNIVHIARVFSNRLRAKESILLVQKLGIVTFMRVLVHGDSFYLDIVALEKHKDTVRASTNFGEDVDPDDLPPVSDCSEVYSGTGIKYFKKQAPYTRKR